jgi:hypothetical protein
MASPLRLYLDEEKEQQDDEFIKLYNILGGNKPPAMKTKIYSRVVHYVKELGVVTTPATRGGCTIHQHQLAFNSILKYNHRLQSDTRTWTRSLDNPQPDQHICDMVANLCASRIEFSLTISFTSPPCSDERGEEIDALFNYFTGVFASDQHLAHVLGLGKDRTLADELVYIRFESYRAAIDTHSTNTIARINLSTRGPAPTTRCKDQVAAALSLIGWASSKATATLLRRNWDDIWAQLPSYEYQGA